MSKFPKMTIYRAMAKAEDSNPPDGENKQDEVVDNAGPLSGNPRKTGDGMGTEFVKKSDSDLGEAEQGIPTASTRADENDDNSLDKDRETVGINIVIPPRNDVASPESPNSDPDGEAPYPLPNKEECAPHQVSAEEWVIVLEYNAYAFVSQKTRDEMDSSDFGWPEEKKYPVKDEKHFHAAVELLGRAPSDKQGMIKENLKKIARKRGYKLPDSWS